MRWLGFWARIDAICHKIRYPKHDVRWRTNVEKSCSGDITCETCSIAFWCRGLENKEMKSGQVDEHS